MLCRNDNHPVFALPEYRRELREGDTEFEPGLVLRATDRDGPLQGGGTVFYSLQSINTDAPVFQVSKAIICQLPVLPLKSANNLSSFLCSG